MRCADERTVIIMSENLLKRVYRKKHFYKVTWTRSEALLKSTPWLKPAEHDFCMVGYSQPTCKEAEAFIGDIMYDRLFDTVGSVEEISREEALRDFHMENWRSQKVFCGQDRSTNKTSLDDIVHDASSRAELSYSAKDSKTVSLDC